jgi:hypothetical protein
MNCIFERNFTYSKINSVLHEKLSEVEELIYG